MKNKDLVALCAQQPWNREAWLEFYNRFDERIWLVINRECKEKGISEDVSESNQVIQDLVQDVYVRLVENDCKALKNFKGTFENSIFTYLGKIANSVVCNHITNKKAKKRPPIQKSIDEPLWNSKERRKVLFEEILKLPYNDSEVNIDFKDIKDKIEKLLDKILKGKHKQRNKIIFKLYLYEEYSPNEIAAQFGFGLSAKTVNNIIRKIILNLRKEW